MEGYSTYFTFEELTDSEGHPELVKNNRIDAIEFKNAGKRLSKLLESIRHILGDHPISVNSGYRNEVLNKAVGGVDKVVNGKKVLSSHRRFEAADITPTDKPLKESFNALLRAYQGGLLPDLRKCIIEKCRWLHIEVSMSEGDYKGFLTTADGINFTKVA